MCERTGSAMKICFTSGVESLIIKLSVVEILVSSLEVISIQIAVDSAPSQRFKTIGTALASVSSSVTLEEFAIRRLVKSHDRRSIVHLNCAVIKVHLGNTINHRAGISSKAFPFETSKEDLRIDVEEEEEEEKRDTGDEGVQEERVDNLFTLAHDLIEDRYYLDDDDSTVKFNSNRIDVCPWPNIDFVNSDINWKISNTVYRENEVKWIIETYRE
ncbi:hypothetical protein V1477_001541 [Vespula maculifrons]|uniref:Uncharacterized protein n=1 Tax=Vespula maculifrons TaxID=7453 RepID=A0ABD2D016_VESMC